MWVCGSGAGVSHLHHGLPWGVVVDEVGAAQPVVRVVHHLVLSGLLPPEVGVVGVPKQTREQGGRRGASELWSDGSDPLGRLRQWVRLAAPWGMGVWPHTVLDVSGRLVLETRLVFISVNP